METPTAYKSRFSIRRSFEIHEALQGGRPVNCSKLAEELGVCRKTIVRDIAAMRDLNLPIEFDPRANAYRYTRAVAAFPTQNVSEGDVFALSLAQQALKPYQGTPLHRQLQRTFEKLTAGLKESVSFSDLGRGSVVSFKHVGLAHTEPEVFTTLHRAVAQQREATFEYKKAGATAWTIRRVQPYHLTNRDNLWYLVAFDHKREKALTFALPRMRKVVLLNKKFVRPKDFSVDRFFSSALGAHGGEGNHDVRIRFSAQVADRVKEREWHDSQKIETLPDGAVEVRLRLGSLAEIERLILGWGPQAEVLSPPELRASCRRTILEMGKVYGTSADARG